jgi:hypothetical protein
MYCRLLHCSVILSIGSTLKSSRKIRSGCRWEAEDKEMMEKRRREEAAEKEHKKGRKGGVLLRTGRRGTRSLSVCAEQKQRWRRILMP